MKTWGIVLGILVVLTIFCSPVLAISKNELISHYHLSDTSGGRPAGFSYPMSLGKQGTEFEIPEIVYNLGPSPSSSMTTAEWLNGPSNLPWGSFPGVPEPGSYNEYFKDLRAELKHLADPDLPAQGSVPAYMCGDCGLTDPGVTVYNDVGFGIGDCTGWDHLPHRNWTPTPR
jgi:hypothetical protein